MQRRKVSTIKGTQYRGPLPSEYQALTSRPGPSTTTTTPSRPKPPTIPEFSLTSQVILVSGGARGLGLCQAEALLESGATVYVLDIIPTPSEAFKQAQYRAHSRFGTNLHYRKVDVQDSALLNRTIEAIVAKEGRLDGLIAAAGIQQEVAALQCTAEDANRMFAVNLTGVLMTAQAVARQIIRLEAQSQSQGVGPGRQQQQQQQQREQQQKKKGGSIVLIASMSGTVANRDLSCTAYNCSKAGLQQMARSLAAEWGMHGIRVNSISPGYILTEMVLDLFKEFPERRGKWAGENMLGRLSKPEDYRGAAVFLLSEASSFVTGADLRIDGGHCAW